MKEYPSIEELFANYKGNYKPVELDTSNDIGRESLDGELSSLDLEEYPQFRVNSKNEE